MFENFPYSNFHDLNADWLINRVKNVETSEANAKASEENAKASELEAKVLELSAQGFALQANNHAQYAHEQAQYAHEQAQASAQSAQDAKDTVENTNAQVALLQSRVDNIIPSGTQTEGNTELLDIRVAEDGQIYDSAGNSVRGQVRNLKNDLNDTQDWMGYPKNLFDARAFVITNTNNWSIDSATKTAITITHKTTYSIGFPFAPLDLPSGDYVFHADYSNSGTSFSIRTNGTWVKALTDGEEFTIDSTETNNIYFSNETTGTYIITNISVIAKEEPNGKIQEIEDDISQLSSTASVLSAQVDDLQDGFADIADPIIDELTGEETVKQAINRSGMLIAAGSDYYRVLKFQVTAGKTYWLTANANFTNLLWCFYDNNDNIIQLGTESASGGTFTSVTDQEVIGPIGATYIRIGYNTTVNRGALKTLTGYTTAKWLGKKWVCVGDSLTAENIRTTKHYFDYVAEETGIITINMGVSGSGYARMADSNQAFYQRISSCPTDADVVTIFGSFNDLGAGLQIGSVDDTGTDTLAGCINTTITNLQTVIPLVNLGIVAPTPWNTAQPSTSGQDYNYVEMLKAICERRSIPFLDLWRCSNLRPWDADFRAIAYSKDGGSGTHPDENGHKLIAPRFKGFLETLLM